MSPESIFLSQMRSAIHEYKYAHDKELIKKYIKEWKHDTDEYKLLFLRIMSHMDTYYDK